jgi:hypothetical protein
MKLFLTYDMWVEQLATKIYEISYTTKAGGHRVLRCTRSGQYIDYVSPTTRKSERYDAQKYIRAYDLDDKCWKSFNPNNVTKYKQLPASTFPIF